MNRDRIQTSLRKALANLADIEAQLKAERANGDSPAPNTCTIPALGSIEDIRSLRDRLRSGILTPADTQLLDEMLGVHEDLLYYKPKTPEGRVRLPFGVEIVK